MLFYLLLIATTPFLSIACSQESQNADDTPVAQDGLNPVPPPPDQSDGNEGIVSTPATMSTSLPKNHAYNVCLTICLSNARKPMCGGDDIDYINREVLECVKFCGKDVEFTYYGPCLERRTG